MVWWQVTALKLERQTSKYRESQLTRAKINKENAQIAVPGKESNWWIVRASIRTTPRLKNSRGTQSWGTPLFHVMYIQELNQVLTVNIREIFFSCYLAEGGEKKLFWSSQSSLFVTKPVLRRNELLIIIASSAYVLSGPNWSGRREIPNISLLLTFHMWKEK